MRSLKSCSQAVRSEHLGTFPVSSRREKICPRPPEAWEEMAWLDPYPEEPSMGNLVLSQGLQG